MQSVSIRYSTSLSRMLVRILRITALFWCVIPLVWIIACTAPLVANLVAHCQLPHAILSARGEILQFIFNVIAPVCTIIAGCFALLVFLDDRIIFSRRGITLPLSLCVQFQSHRNRLWSELKNTELIKRKGRPVCLKLSFTDGRFVVFEASEMSGDDLNKLMIATKTLVPPTLQLVAKDDDEYGTKSSQLILDATSFTSLWEAELTLRFRATTYVPLLPGKVMRSGIVIERALSYGGSSAIYLAVKSNRKKIILKEFVVPDCMSEESREKALAMFKKEAAILAKLNHAEIAKIYDHFVENNRHYMILEYIPGEDLRRLVARRGPISERVVYRWAKQLAEILVYLESRTPPVVHRDLTPENLVLRADGKLALIDFGAANEFIGTVTGTVVGKQGYISPEQFRGKAIGKSDVYSLGCTLHFLLTAEEPEALEVSQPKTLNFQISDGMNDLILVMTAQDTQMRPSAKQIVKTLELLNTFKEALV